MVADEKRDGEQAKSGTEDVPVGEIPAGATTAGVDPGSCRFFEKDSGEEILPVWIVHELDDLEPGRVIEVHKPEGEKIFYNIDRVDEGDVPRVQLVRARSNIWKFLLLLAILAGSWYAIKFILELF